MTARRCPKCGTRWTDTPECPTCAVDMMLEQSLAAYALHYAGLFAGACATKYGIKDKAMIAHAMWLLARAAEERYEEWLA